MTRHSMWEVVRRHDSQESEDCAAQTMGMGQIQAHGRDDMDAKQWFLQFSNKQEEADYASNLNQQNRPALLRYLLIPIPVLLLEMVYFLLSVDAWRTVHTLAISVRGSLVLMTVALWLLVWRKKDIVCEKIALVWAVLSSLLLVSCSSLALSKVIGDYDVISRNFLVDDKVVHNDASIVLALEIVCSSTLVLIQVRSCRSWLLPVSQAVFYGVVCVFRLNALTLFGNVLNGLLFCLLNGIVWFGCYQSEKTGREKWSENWILRREIAKQRTLNELHKTQLAEVNERLEALMMEESVAVVSKASDSAVKVYDGHGQVQAPKVIEPSEKATSEPNELLTSFMGTAVADADRLHSMAARIREPNYDIGAFFQDAMVAFPELALFHSSAAAGADATSGRSLEDEYQRTIGAMFAVYFLLRLELDGKRGWCFGVSEGFHIHREARDMEYKRDAFMKNADWQSIAQLVSSAVGSSQERIEAMLCLTAFHDIMKVPGLCPCVAERHAPYRGYAAGATINDHDLALAYVLEHFPEVLPSFRILPAESRKIVLFTQGKMDFNHGWFVQAEAPPGAMLRNLRSVLSHAHAEDLAFYFLHWLTDLSGAEGRPLAGAEKFVLKFPVRVLGEFMWSIPFLQRLLEKTEVVVMEDYLKAKWERNFPGDPLPRGESYVALLRLAVMAQANASEVIEHFRDLPEACREVLSTELACTGAEDQHFEHIESAGGPAFLVYYGPALLQRCSGSEDVISALMCLAGVLAAGRALWPNDPAAEGQTVKLEISQLVKAGKEPKRDDSVWALLPQNRMEARVEALEPARVNVMNMVCERYWVLDAECEHRTQAPTSPSPFDRTVGWNGRGIQV